MSNKLSIANLRRIISEEVELINEAVDLAAEANVYNTANKLLIAIEAFKKNGNPNMVSALTVEFTKLEKHLNNMKRTPGQYVVTVKPEKVQKISLKPKSKDDIM